MKASTLAFLLAGAAALGATGWILWSATAERRAWWEILSLQGKTLWNADRATHERFDRLLRPRLPTVEDPPVPMTGWTVIPLTAASRVIVFEISAIGWGIPGDFPVRAHVFTSEGEWRSTEDFSGGWRTMWVDARASRPAGVGAELIEVLACGSMDNSSIPPRRQYFGLRKDHLVLVRLEDSSGKAVPNEFGAPYWTVGPALKAYRREDWEGALSSENPVDRLRALVWIGGTHVNPDFENDTPYSHEDVKVGSFCENLRRKPSISARLRELADSPSPWEREAALLALSPQQYH